MDFSLFYFANDGAPPPGEGIYDLLLQGARFADRNGFAAVWMPERHFHPFGGIYPNPSVTAAALATITDRIALRAGSVVAPLHHPIRIAEEWAVVDNLSGGRVGISFAPGWHHRDFALAPDRYPDRRSVLVNAVDTVRALWRGDELDATDGLGAPTRVRLHPRPVQPELPVWVTTAGSLDTYELAGKLGANVLTRLHREDDEALGAKIARYREVLAASHPDRTGQVTIMLHTFLGHDIEVVRETVRRPLQDYLASALDLRALTPSRAGRLKDPERVGERERRLAVRRAFDRYFASSALLGTVEHCAGLVRRLDAIGVNEIACLIDYGPDLADTLGSLELVAELASLVNSA
jgi:natural product biosynthesis luciferase-like monooxygenase protein